MQSTTLSGTSAENASCFQWGLKRNITPCFGARLVQEATAYTFWLTGQDLMAHSVTKKLCVWTRHFH